MKSRLNYKIYFWIRVVLAVLLLLFAICTIRRFAGLMGQTKSGWDIFIVVFWTLGPPLWFFFEYYAIDKRWIKPASDRNGEPMDVDACLAMVKTYADYSSKIWAAVLAVVTFLFAQGPASH